MFFYFKNTYFKLQSLKTDYKNSYTNSIFCFQKYKNSNQINAYLALSTFLLLSLALSPLLSFIFLFTILILFPFHPISPSLPWPSLYPLSPCLAPHLLSLSRASSSFSFPLFFQNSIILQKLCLKIYFDN